MSKTYAIAYGTEPDRVAIWCTGRKLKNGTLVFEVINGAWNGTLKNGAITVRDRYGKANGGFPATLVWEGEVPGRYNGNYNDAIAWINKQLEKKHG